MINTPKQAMEAALKTERNVLGMCQAVVRSWFNAPAVGDVDGDGRADAEDGWKSEPEWARHPGDRNPPAGFPLAFEGGRNDDGHRALSLPGGKVRSTDFDTATQRYKERVTGTANSIEALERAFGMRYLGWSSTISGKKIPMDNPLPQPKPKRPAEVQDLIDRAKALKKKSGPVRKAKLKVILGILRTMGKGN